MTNTISAYPQTEVVLEQAWDPFDSASFFEVFSPLPRSTASVAPIVSPYSAETTSLVSQTPPSIKDSRAALKARYKAMPNAAWFKAAHEDRSLGEAVKVT